MCFSLDVRFSLNSPIDHEFWLWVGPELTLGIEEFGGGWYELSRTFGKFPKCSMRFH